MPEGMVARASMPESTPLRVRFGAVDLLVRGALVAGCLACVSARAGWADSSNCGAVELLVRGALVAGCLARGSARAGWADRSAVLWV